MFRYTRKKKSIRKSSLRVEEPEISRNFYVFGSVRKHFLNLLALQDSILFVHVSLNYFEGAKFVCLVRSKSSSSNIFVYIVKVFSWAYCIFTKMPIRERLLILWRMFYMQLSSPMSQLQSFNIIFLAILKYLFYCGTYIAICSLKKSYYTCTLKYTILHKN